MLWAKSFVSFRFHHNFHTVYYLECFFRSNLYCEPVTSQADYTETHEKKISYLFSRSGDFVLKQNRINHNLLDDNVLIDIFNSSRITL